MQPPRFVYKYHPLNVFLFELLVNHRFYLADRAQLNDPLDAGFTMQFEDYLKLYNERYGMQEDLEQEKRLKFLFDFQIESGENKMLLEFSGLPEAFRTTCFTEDGNNPLMWSHYAANHNGVCLKFDLEKDDRLRESLKPVTYLDELVAIKEKADFERSLLTKLNPWSVEKEWRILKEENYFDFERDSLIEIVLGLKVLPSTIDWLCLLAENVYYRAKVRRLVVRGGKLIKLDSSQLEVEDDFIPKPDSDS